MKRPYKQKYDNNQSDPHESFVKHCVNDEYGFDVQSDELNQDTKELYKSKTWTKNKDKDDLLGYFAFLINLDQDNRERFVDLMVQFEDEARLFKLGTELKVINKFVTDHPRIATETSQRRWNLDNVAKGIRHSLSKRAVRYDYLTKTD